MSKRNASGFKYAIKDTDRHGNVRWYLNRQGQRKIRLVGVPGSKEFERGYQMAMRNIKPIKSRDPIRITPEAAGYVYFLKVSGNVKIGFSTNAINRLCTLMTGIAGKVQSFVFVPGTMTDERILHEKFTIHRINGEWFKDHPQLRQAMAQAAAYGVPPISTLADRDRKTKIEHPTPTRG